jgi:enterochelin esterase-like enzyme
MRVIGGRIETSEAPSDAVGSVRFAVYLPPGYENCGADYPVLYLLHGRGETLTAWQRVTPDLDELIAAGRLQPIVVVMPDAPWNEAGHWYTDSAYAGAAPSGPGTRVDTALSRDLVDYVDMTFRTVANRAMRAVGGYSMGGAGALCFALAHQDRFSAAIVLSPAAYAPQPPAGSSTRKYGAYGVGDDLFDANRYEELNYPSALERFDPGLPVHLFIAAGDDESANPDPVDAIHDIDVESVRLYNAACRVSGVTATLRILDGGHDWDVWQPAFREAVVEVSGHLSVTPAAETPASTPGARR